MAGRDMGESRVGGDEVDCGGEAASGTAVSAAAVGCVGEAAGPAVGVGTPDSGVSPFGPHATTAANNSNAASSLSFIQAVIAVA